MKNKNKAHFTVVYIFCFLFVIVKYIHRTGQMASTMRKILLVQSVTKKKKKKSCPIIDELIVLLIKRIHQPTVTFKLCEAFITLWRSNGDTIKSSSQERPPQFPSPANNKPSTQFLNLWFFPCIIEVYYHPEVRNCLSILITRTHPFVIIQLLLSQKKERKKEAVIQLKQSVKPRKQTL